MSFILLMEGGTTTAVPPAWPTELHTAVHGLLRNSPRTVVCSPWGLPPPLWGGMQPPSGVSCIIYFLIFF